MAQLVVIVGPIASGKSTVGDALGARFRDAGRATAVLDLDEIVATIGGFAGLLPENFHTSQLVFGELVGAWLRRGVDVIAHGPFFDADEDRALLRAVPPGMQPRRVMLLATFEVALARVTGDADRALSKHPEYLRRTYDRFERLLPTMPPSEWSFDTATTSWRDIVDQLAGALLR